MTTVDIVATVTISIVVLFLVVIPVIRIFFSWKKIKKLPVKNIDYYNHETDWYGDPTCKGHVGNIWND